jgi:chorismate lyase / 3-hydroxybenzoate synthase
LAGEAEEKIFPDVKLVMKSGAVTLFGAGEILLGVARVPFEAAELDHSTQRLYGQILDACQGRQLYRIWNYVPRINEFTGTLENYRAFCRGRSVAFERAWGSDYKRFLPAASAVGSDGEEVAVVFAAGRGDPCHFENPEQVPAYEYPQEHGPRAPSFARATSARIGGKSYLFVSGTAAIKGHATVSPGSLPGQVACTLDNLRLISLASGAGEDLGAGSGWARTFKIYLRNAAELLPARSLLEGKLLLPGDRVHWLRSDVCRASLNIEIEATLTRDA